MSLSREIISRFQGPILMGVLLGFLSKILTGNVGRSPKISQMAKNSLSPPQNFFSYNNIDNNYTEMDSVVPHVLGNLNRYNVWCLELQLFLFLPFFLKLILSSFRCRKRKYIFLSHIF